MATYTPNMSSPAGAVYAPPPSAVIVKPKVVAPVNVQPPTYIPPTPVPPTVTTGPTSDAGFRATDASVSGATIGLAQAFQRVNPGVNPDAAIGSVMPRSTGTIASPVAAPPTSPTVTVSNTAPDPGSAEATAAWQAREAARAAGVGSTPPSTITTGGYVAPGSSLDDQIKQYLPQVLTPDQLQAQVEAAAVGINKKYDQEAQQIEQDIRDQSAADFSNLAGVGTGINPLSSAGASVSSKNAALRSKFMSNMEMRRSAELQSSKEALYGKVMDATKAWRDELNIQRTNAYDTAKKDYDASQDAFKNSITKLNSYISMTKEQRETSTAEKSDASDSIKTLLTQFGSAAFDGVTDEDMRALEKAAGLPAGSLKTGIKTLKETEIANKAAASTPDLKFVPGGKNQVSGYFDPSTGKFVSYGGSLPGSGGGSGSGNGVPGASDDVTQAAATAYFNSTGTWPTKQQLPLVVGAYKGYTGGSGAMSVNSSQTQGPFAAGAQAKYKYDPFAAMMASAYGGGVSGPPAYSGDLTVSSASDDADYNSVMDTINSARSGL